jgi:hypothetical protein
LVLSLLTVAGAVAKVKALVVTVVLAVALEAGNHLLEELRLLGRVMLAVMAQAR